MSTTRKVLIIDDDADQRALLGELLRLENWQVIEADDGNAGLDIIRAQRPDVVLCDLLMPRGNGFLVCRKVREDLGLRHTRIIVTSGRDYESDRLAAREAGADEYLVKPIEPKNLFEAISRLTADVKSPARSGPGTQLPAGGPTCVKFWGVRGSIPTPGPATVGFGGNTTCVEVRTGGEIIILDGGTGLRTLGRDLLAEFGGQPLHLTMLLSHTHWDHIQGLPFFQPIYRPDCRLRILGFEGARNGLVHVLTSQMESPYFPVPFAELPGNVQIDELKDMEFRVGNIRVQAHFANHPGICVGYRIFTDDGSVAFFPDNEPHTRVHNTSPQPAGAGRAAFDFAEAQEKKFVEFLGGVDVLILDSQFDAQEYEQHIGWGHGCVDYAVAVAMKAGVKRLVLFHHDPDHDDAKVEAMLAHAHKLVADAKSTLVVEAAREGRVIELTRSPK